MLSHIATGPSFLPVHRDHRETTASSEIRIFSSLDLLSTIANSSQQFALRSRFPTAAQSG